MLPMRNILLAHGYIKGLIGMNIKYIEPLAFSSNGEIKCPVKNITVNYRSTAGEIC